MILYETHKNHKNKLDFKYDIIQSNKLTVNCFCNSLANDKENKTLNFSREKNNSLKINYGA